MGLSKNLCQKGVNLCKKGYIWVPPKICVKKTIMRKIKYDLKAKKCTIEYIMQKIFWIEILPRKLNFYEKFNQKPMYFQAPFSYTKNKYFWTKCISLGREMLKVQ